MKFVSLFFICKKPTTLALSDYIGFLLLNFMPKCLYDTMLCASSCFVWPWRKSCQVCLFVYVYLWCLKLCSRSEFLDLNVLSQKLQGMQTPSKWFASMCFFMSLPIPSFPHILQMYAFLCPFGSRFSLFSIIELTFSSNSLKSLEKLFGIATTLSGFLKIWLAISL